MKYLETLSAIRRTLYFVTLRRKQTLHCLLYPRIVFNYQNRVHAPPITGHKLYNCRSLQYCPLDSSSCRTSSHGNDNVMTKPRQRFREHAKPPQGSRQRPQKTRTGRKCGPLLCGLFCEMVLELDPGSKL